MKKKILKSATLLAGIGVVCISTLFPSFAGTWKEEGRKYYGDDGKAKTGWVQVEGKWYYLDKSTGNMKTGWLLDTNNKWYFLNTTTGNTLGEMLIGWQWIDGYCYNFLPDGSMEHSVITADSYILNENGQWTSSAGVVMYNEDKGISSNNQVTIVEQNTSTPGATNTENTTKGIETTSGTSASAKAKASSRPASVNKAKASKKSDKALNSSNSSGSGSFSSSSSNSSGSGSSSSSSSNSNSSGSSSSSSSNSDSSGSSSSSSSSSSTDAKSGATS